MNDFQISPGSVAAPVLKWLNVNFHGFFAFVSSLFEVAVQAIIWLLSLAPTPATIALLAIVAALVAGWRRGLLTVLGFSVCVVLGMWTATVQTISLVTISVFASISLGIPAGVFLSKRPRLQTLTRPLLDVMQTLPPWVYLVPAVILFGLGTVPAMISTVVYGLAPMIRLTILAMSQIPHERIELGTSIGATKLEILKKVELPSALPTILVGINQCIMLSLAMVVLAGLVGAGGLGAEVTRGLTRMDFGLGLRASLAIVFLAIIMDRVFRGSIPTIYLTKAH